MSIRRVVFESVFACVFLQGAATIILAGPRPPQAPDPAELERIVSAGWARNVPCEVQANVPKGGLREEAPADPVETTAQKLARLLSVRVAINYNGQFLRWGTLGEYLSLGGSLDAYRANGAISEADLSFLKYYYAGTTAAPVVHPVAQPMPVYYSPPVYYSAPVYGGACILPGGR